MLSFRNASSAHKEDMRGETAHLELRRIYHCAAYNCMISIISCTQTEQKFYTGLLFSDNPAKVGLISSSLQILGHEKMKILQLQIWEVL